MKTPPPQEPALALETQWQRRRKLKQGAGEPSKTPGSRLSHVTHDLGEIVRLSGRPKTTSHCTRHAATCGITSAQLASDHQTIATDGATNSAMQAPLPYS